MKIVSTIVNPILIALIIVGAVYIYFLYHDVPELGWFKNKEGEVEEETIQRNVKQNAPNTAIIAEQYGQGPYQQPQQYQQGPYQQPEQYGQGQYPYPEQYPFQDPYGLQQTAAVNPNTFQQPVKTPEKVLHEGHWIGLEVVPLTSTIARANHIPSTISGVLIDEVTLLAAEVGLMAGDVITAINGYAVQDLNSFKLATKQVANSQQAIVSLYRNGSYTDMKVYSTEELGVAQMEAAPMIVATDRSPHGYYGPCDRCHTISKTSVNTGQLGKDAGDVLTKVAPPIEMGMKPPHGDRGRCTNCHKII